MSDRNELRQAARKVLDPDEVEGVLTSSFYAPSSEERPKVLYATEPLAEKPTHYKVICISMYTEDLKRLDTMVDSLKARGLTKANRSALIRYALGAIDLDNVPKGSVKASEDWARELGIPTASVELYRSTDVIDLHVDSFIWQRTLGYDLTKRHRAPLWGALLGQVDFPRILEAELAGATWVITTNPLREAADRAATFEHNIDALCRTFARDEAHFAVVTNAREYDAARAAGKHAAFIGIQGGNALDSSLPEVERLCDGRVLRITLVHLSSSRIGATSSPLRLRDTGLSAFGASMVSVLNERRVIVDLAHISAQGFWAACEAHAKDVPFVVTHTGVSGVHRHWRNLDDDQIRAVARSGGVVGIMYHAPFLGDRPWAGRVDTVARHLEYVYRIGGEDTPALGSDWDGSIITPRDMPTCLELPRLVAALMARKIPERAIKKLLGQNFLRVVRQIRG